MAKWMGGRLVRCKTCSRLACFAGRKQVKMLTYHLATLCPRLCAPIDGCGRLLGALHILSYKLYLTVFLLRCIPSSRADKMERSEITSANSRSDATSGHREESNNKGVPLCRNLSVWELSYPNCIVIPFSMSISQLLGNCLLS